MRVLSDLFWGGEQLEILTHQYLSNHLRRTEIWGKAALFIFNMNSILATERKKVKRNLDGAWAFCIDS